MKINKDSKHWILPPWDHQIEAINRALSAKPDGSERTSYGFFTEVGTGKSKMLVETLRLLYAKNKRMLRTLIVCPPIVMNNWPNEFLKHSKVNDIVVTVGTGKKRVELIQNKMWSPAGTTPRSVVCVLSYSSLTMPKVLDAIMKWAPEVVVYDEVHWLKNSQSKRSKAAYKISKDSKYRYGLTGTPVANTPMDLFGIYKVLDVGDSFGVSLTAFRSKYFYDKNAGMNREVHFPNWQIQSTGLDKITAILEDTSMSVKKEDCLDLPPLVVKDVFVDLSDEQKRAYNEMKRDLITFIDSNPDPATAQLAVTKALRLQQIASGHIKLESGDVHEFKETPRDKALAELLETISARKEKTIVWAVFKQNYASIKAVCERLDIKYVEVHGGVPPKKKFERLDAFNEDPDVLVFIGHPESVGIGVNMVASKYSIFYSRNFSFVTDEQAEGRNYRGGSEIHDKVTRINIVASDTVDEKVAEALKRKEELSAKVLSTIAHTF